MGFPASVKGPGYNLALADVCKTPPNNVPVPYFNVGLHANAAMESKIVFFGGFPALNLGSFIPSTTGDGPGVGGGVKSGTVLGPGFFEVGSPIVWVEKLQAVRVTSAITGNNENATGTVVSPGIPTVLIAYDAAGAALAGEPLPARVRLEGERLDAFVAALDRAPPPPVHLLEGSVGYVRVERFAADTVRVFFNAYGRLVRDGARVLLVDLRGCPGGDLEVAYRLAAEFLPSGSVLGHVTDADGDTTERVAHADGPYALPVVLLVDGETRSAAEAFAGALGHHGRAVVVGGPTFGKRSVRAVRPDATGGADVVTAATFELP